MNDLQELLNTKLESYQLIYAITQKQSEYIQANDLENLWITIKEKERLLNTIREVDKFKNKFHRVSSFLDENPELEALRLQCYDILKKNMELEKNNHEMLTSLKDNINSGLIDLKKIDQGIKKYIPSSKPKA